MAWGRHLYLLLTVATLGRCAYPTPTFTTRHGLRVHAEEHGESQLAMEVATENLIRRVGEEPDYDEYMVRRLFNSRKIRVIVKSAPFECFPVGECSGIAAGTNVYYVWDKCISSSAFIHELMHVIHEWFVAEDPNHELPGLWSNPEDVVPSTRLATCETVCPGTCY